ncbi:Cation/calcium exchanger 5 [Linum grandiflorum]
MAPSPILISTAAAISLTLITPLLIATLTTEEETHHPNRRALISELPHNERPNISCSTLTQTNGIINYLWIHFCAFDSNSFLSVPSLSLFILLQFYILIKTAQSHFSVVTTKLATHLNLSPSMGGVTLLALGNGAPDVFASLAAVRSGQYRTGFGAILSAGTFVSAFVVGFVAIYAAPFSVDPGSFVRDVGFYLVAAMSLFYVYLSGEITFWQAAGFVGFYVFFVGIVFWMDLGIKGSGGKGRRDRGDYAAEMMMVDFESGEKVDVERLKASKEEERAAGLLEKAFGSLKLLRKEEKSSGFLAKISKVWEVPVLLLLNLTIPQTAPSEWNRFYQSANIVLCPLALLYACSSIMPLNHPIGFVLSTTHLPLWFITLLAGSSLALLHFIVERDPPKTEQLPVVLLAFVMSVFWISTTAGELLNCLAALGTILEVAPSLLGLTVLAWGNSVGDLVADVAVAKAGQPAMAMAGCFAGPMFNMLVGLGSALVVQTANVYPEAYELNFHISIIVAFVFLLLSLMGSLLVVTWSRFRVPKFWGFCLVGLYAFFVVVSLLIATLFA